MSALSPFQPLKSTFSSLCLALFLWIANSSFLSAISLAQDSTVTPESEPENLEVTPPGAPAPRTSEITPSQVPAPIFRKTDIPPQGYSPPQFKPKTSQQFNIYRLDIGDGISVNVLEFPEFNFVATIDGEGNIIVPLIGRIAAVGLTLDELEAKIRYELARRYLQEEPQVIASLTTPRPAQLTLLGEIIRPGYYLLAPNTPLTQVLLAAGGSTSKADLRSVIVRRSLVDGTILEEKVDLYTPLIRGESLPDFRLQGGDTVIVSRLQPGQDQGYDRQLLARTSLTQPAITVRVLVPLQPYGVALRNLSLPNGSTFLDVIASLPPGNRLLTKIDEIALLRFDPDKGGIITQTLSPIAAAKGEIAQNVPLQDDDVIVVSRTLLGGVFALINTLTEPLSTIVNFVNFFYRVPAYFNFGNYNYNTTF